MNSADSWIDVSAVAELLRQLQSAPVSLDEPGYDDGPEVEPHPGRLIESPRPAFPDAWRPSFRPSLDDLALSSEASFHELFTPDHDTSSPVRSALALRLRAREALDQLKRFQAEAPPRPALPTTPSPGTSTIAIPTFPGKRLQDRLRAFAAWIRDVTGASQLFLTDAQGYSLLDDDDTSDHASAVSASLQLMSVLEQVRSRMNNTTARSGVYLPLSENEWLAVLECDSAIGQVCLSLVTHAPLSAPAADQLIQTLRQSLS